MADQAVRGFVPDQFRKVQHGIGENHRVRRHPEGHEFVAGTLGGRGNSFVEPRANVAHERFAGIVDAVDVKDQLKKPVIRAQRVEQAFRIAVPASDRLRSDKRGFLHQCRCSRHCRARVHRPADPRVATCLREVVDPTVQDLMYQGKPKQQLTAGSIDVNLFERLRLVLRRRFLRGRFQALLDNHGPGPGEPAAVFGGKYQQLAVILRSNGQTRAHLGKRDRARVVVNRRNRFQVDVRRGIARDPDDAVRERGDHDLGSKHRNSAVVLAHPQKP